MADATPWLSDGKRLAGGERFGALVVNKASEAGETHGPTLMMTGAGGQNFWTSNLVASTLQGDWFAGDLDGFGRLEEAGEINAR